MLCIFVFLFAYMNEIQKKGKQPALNDSRNITQNRWLCDKTMTDRNRRSFSLGVPGELTVDGRLCQRGVSEGRSVHTHAHSQLIFGHLLKFLVCLRAINRIIITR